MSIVNSNNSELFLISTRGQELFINTVQVNQLGIPTDRGPIAWSLISQAFLQFHDDIIVIIGS